MPIKQGFNLKILGISAYYHDAAICLIEDGKILYAAQEERFSRKKNDDSFPVLAIKNCLESTNIRLTELDAVVYYEKPYLKLERILKTFIQDAPRGFVPFLKAMHVWTTDKLFIKQNIFSKLKEVDTYFDRKKTSLLFSEHHLSHAASAFFASSFSNAAILTIDGVGEYATTSMCIGNNNTIQKLKEIYFPHSIGLLYSAATYFLGFKVNCDEYKVMGLAAYGIAENPETQHYIKIIEAELIQINDDNSYQLKMKQFSFTQTLKMVDEKKWKKLFNITKRTAKDEITQSHCNLAYAFQKVTERVVLNLCNEIKKITNSEYLCLAGGVALNSVINGIIIDKKIFKQVFIQPAAGDAGGALGAALAGYHIHFGKERTPSFPDGMQNSLLGNTFSQDEINDIISKHSRYIICKNEEELCIKTANYIADGNVIGWLQGRMEFGPRALGNRSILADARNKDMQLHLNLKIKNRESFRPFAPAVLEEDASMYFDSFTNSPYMLQVHKVAASQLLPLPENYHSLTLKEKLYTIKSTIPAVTHVDLSARIQTVNVKEHPLFYQLIKMFKQQTGVGMVINTSFNVNDEPIVCTPTDAYNCFTKTEMDILVIGNIIFYK